MTNEIAKAVPYDLPLEDALTFAGKVLDRFRNPSIVHHWINISLNYTSKLEMRIVQVLLRYAELYKAVPENMALGFAAYLVFMKAVKAEAAVYYGNFNGADYPIKDPKAGYFYEQWKNYPVDQLVKNVLTDTSLWNADLTAIPGFAERVTENVEDILQYGMLEVMQNEKVKI
jgi:tagaturonate reductase